MEYEIFVRQPSVELHRGIRVRKETEITYESENAKQTVKDLVLNIEAKESGTSGLNSYESENKIRIRLNEGDILLFEEKRGFYLPASAFCSPQQGAEDLAALEHVKLPEEITC